MRLVRLTVLSLVLVTSAFAAQPSGERPEDRPPATGQAGGSLTEEQRQQQTQVLQRLHHDAVFEMELGRLAQDKAQNADVRRFGETLVRDHQDTVKQVMQYATRTGIDIQGVQPARPEKEPSRTGATEPGQPGTTPTMLDPAQQSELERFRGLEGAEFDKSFLSHVITSHQSSVQLVNNASAGAQGDYKTLLDGVKPVLDQHLRTAGELQQKIGVAS